MNVIVTRPKERAEEFIKRLKEKGFNPIHIPCLEIKYNKVNINIDNYDLIVFTSPSGVIGLYKNLDNKDREKVKDKIIAVIGEKTGKTFKKYFNRPPDIVPEEFRAESLLKELKKYEDKKILIPTTRATRDVLKVLNPTYIYVYESVEPRDLKDKIKIIKELDSFILTFTSGLIAENFLKYVDEELKEKIKKNYIIAIGPITAKKVKKFGFNPIIAEKYTIEGIIKKIEELVD
ncbi:uroporphyrinogen-III synthase [Methanocaldococcus sp.]